MVTFIFTIFEGAPLMMFFNRRNARVSPMSEEQRPSLVRQYVSLPNLMLDDTQSTIRPISRTQNASPVYLKKVNYGLLKPTHQFHWLIELEPGVEDGAQGIAYGKYDFVTMLNGEMRVIPTKDEDHPLHLELSENANDVLYAGTVCFDFDKNDNSSITEWTNHSPIYTPDPDLSGQAGLPEKHFNPITDRMRTNTMSQGL